MENKYNVISFSLVKNEEDIIELFVRHNLQYFSHMYIAANMSSDGTFDILLALKDEGLPITLMKDNEVSFAQVAKATLAYHKISELGDFDAIIFMDADEFLVGAMAREMAGEPGTMAYLDRYAYFSQDICATGDDVFSEIPYRLPTPDFKDRAILFHDKSISGRFLISNGYRCIVFIDEKGEQNIVDGEILPNLYIAHFPYRNMEQILSKCIIGWLSIQSYLRKGANNIENLAFHWKSVYDFFVNNNGQISDDLLYKHLLKTGLVNNKSLVYDPICSNILLKYSGLRKNSSLVVKILKLHEDILAAS